LIAGHQGTCGGYIVPNTIPAFENALKHGCDIIEVDAVMSTDGDFFAFHNGKEKVILGVDKDIRTMSTQVIASFRCFNTSGTQINQKETDPGFGKKSSMHRTAPYRTRSS
jgi:glycerophosphoryl diester phosphodiesterase